jgi:hypothetical protein
VRIAEGAARARESQRASGERLVRERLGRAACGAAAAGGGVSRGASGPRGMPVRAATSVMDGVLALQLRRRARAHRRGRRGGRERAERWRRNDTCRDGGMRSASPARQIVLRGAACASGLRETGVEQARIGWQRHGQRRGRQRRSEAGCSVQTAVAGRRVPAFSASRES